MGITKFNHSESKYTFKLADNAGYKRLADLKEGRAYTIRGFFINKKSKYGDHPVAVMEEGFYLDLPKYALDQVKDIMQDDDVTKDINAGHAGILAEQYEKNGHKYTGFKFVDIL